MGGPQRTQLHGRRHAPPPRLRQRLHPVALPVHRSGLLLHVLRLRHLRFDRRGEFHASRLLCVLYDGMLRRGNLTKC